MDGELDFFVVVEGAVEFGGHRIEVLGFAEGPAVEAAQFRVDGFGVVVPHEAEAAFDFLLVGFAVEFTESGVHADEEGHEVPLGLAAAESAEGFVEEAVTVLWEDLAARAAWGGGSGRAAGLGRRGHGAEERRIPCIGWGAPQAEGGNGGQKKGCRRGDGSLGWFWECVSVRDGGSGGVFAAESLEGDGGDGTTEEVGGDVEPDAGWGGEFHDGGTDGDGWVEGATGDVADGEGAGHDGHADGEAVERIAGVGLGGGGIEDDPGEGEGEEEFGDEGLGDVGDGGGVTGFSGEESGGGGGGDGSEDLGTPVGNDVLGVAFTAEEDSEGDGWVVMGAGDVAAGVDHDHEGCSDGEWGDDAGSSGEDRAADGEDEEEGADEFGDVFVHEEVREVRIAEGEDLIETAGDVNEQNQGGG